VLRPSGKDTFDLVFVSQVLFESGFALADLRELVDGLSSDDRLVGDQLG
jgi:hypothetical protein